MPTTEPGLSLDQATLGLRVDEKKSVPVFLDEVRNHGVPSGVPRLSIRFVSSSLDSFTFIAAIAIVLSNTRRTFVIWIRSLPLKGI